MRLEWKCDNRGVDVILDYIGGDYAEKNIKLLAEDGRMVIIGFLKGPRVGKEGAVDYR